MFIPVTFNSFKELLVKGRILRFQRFQFSIHGGEKPRWVLLLNCKAPDRKESRVTLFPLTSNWSRVIRTADDPDDVCVIDDSALEKKSAFTLLKYRPIEASDLYKKYMKMKVKNKGILSEESIQMVNNYIEQFLADDNKAKVLPPGIKGEISPNKANI
jgi:hypothetical protein